ncbi:hypothetical protein [Saccharibacillus deserti]|uniref:hypothetical protein n=1 Tax=Saccharibacillus deserti TaxID=1634444 RepID=UPI0015534AD6|nr:hypothetical protein [Saccharibacillus deserti]
MKRKENGRLRTGMMRAKIRLLAALLIVLAGIGGSLAVKPIPAYACTCAIIDTEEAAGYADTIFSGTAVDRRESPIGSDGGRSSADPVYYRFEVDTAWKGEAYEKMTLSTEMSSESCGADFKMGEKYLVFARKDGNMLTTGLCSGNQSYAAGVDPAAVQQLGEPVERKAGSSPDWPEEGSAIPIYVWAIGGVLVVVVVVVALALARGRRHAAKRNR